MTVDEVGEVTDLLCPLSPTVHVETSQEQMDSPKPGQQDVPEVCSCFLHLLHHTKKIIRFFFQSNAWFTQQHFKIVSCFVRCVSKPKRPHTRG